MNKKELISALAEAAGLTQAAASCAVDAILRAIAEALEKGEPVSLVGFGLFIVNAKFWSLRDCQWSTSVWKNDLFVEPTLIFPIFCQ